MVNLNFDLVHPTQKEKYHTSIAHTAITAINDPTWLLCSSFACKKNYELQPGMWNLNKEFGHGGQCQFKVVRGKVIRRLFSYDNKWRVDAETGEKESSMTVTN